MALPLSVAAGIAAACSRPAPRPAGTAPVAPTQRSDTSGLLGLLGPRLDDPPLLQAGDNGIRLVWVRAFHAPILIRLDHLPGRLRIRWKKWRVGFEGSTPVDTGSQAVDSTVWAAATAQLAASAFWSAPREDSVSTAGVNDGAIWILEAVLSSQYHRVERVLGTAGVQRLGLWLIQLTPLVRDTAPVY